MEFFSQHARIHGRSRKTLSLYAWVFEQVRDHVGDLALDQLDVVTLRRFLFDLLERGWKPTSVIIVHRVLNAFLNWAVHERLTRSNSLDGIPAPKAPKLFPFTLDDTQVAALLKACDRTTRHSCRNYAMLLRFLDCGLRFSEFVNLRLTDVSLTQRSLKVHGKGDRDWVCFAGARTWQLSPSANGVLASLVPWQGLAAGGIAEFFRLPLH